VIIVHLGIDLLYRPFAYSQSIQDIGFKDSFTQITSVIGISLLMILFEKEETWNNRIGKILLIIIPVASMVIYEFIQKFIHTSKFDMQDVLYTLIGGAVIAIIQTKIIR
jgi:hypothetical protein